MSFNNYKYFAPIRDWFKLTLTFGRAKWPRGIIRRGSSVSRLLGLRVRIPAGRWMFVCCECCVLSRRGLCDELITRPEESYRLRCVVVCDLETSIRRRPCLALGRSATGGGVGSLTLENLTSISKFVWVTPAKKQIIAGKWLEEFLYPWHSL